MYQSVPAYVFYTHFDAAREIHPNVAAATSPFEASEGASYYLSSDQRSGFVVREDGELTNVFSTVRGRGAEMLDYAVTYGAVYLDCFDGYLPSLYRRHGFVEVARVPNWTKGCPDVVLMARPGFEHRHGVTA